jgi:hypothetical protein
VNASKVFKIICGAIMVIAATVYSQTSVVHGAVVFLSAAATFLVGYFAGEDI